ncbi:hypothetical protein B9Z55_015024 [Caenorhabditis nigoni]|uniref:CUB domain-containing protein n=1 Tax=Caenorhabditis nigoni TaxID=1611254 RepID=A0A2G5U8A6_9PELO|nr:hypothetical protein B9Z55_015024 [Caenorhabditis nigoni]
MWFEVKICFRISKIPILKRVIHILVRIITTWHRDEEGVINSPNYPNSYDNLEYDTHIIRSDPGTRILMYFEHVETEQNCDVITVSDDYGISGPTLFRLSGNYRNHSVISNQNHLMVNQSVYTPGLRTSGSRTYLTRI